MSSGVAGLKAHQTAMDVVGNNIANVNTYGFKASRTTFRDTLYQTMASATGSNGALGGMNPTQIGYGATASSIEMDTGRAGMSTTGFGGDCYINGEGYFIVGNGEDDDGNVTGSLYTRVGELSFDSAGYLVDGNGRRVLGVNNSAPDSLGTGTVADITSATEPGYIHYDPAQTLKDISIGADGTITATLAGSTVVKVGKIALAYFTNPAGLSQEGGSYYAETLNSGEAAVASPGDGSTGSLVTGALESSNVDLANEFSNMIVYERGYQANSKIITVADTMLETLVNMVR